MSWFIQTCRSSLGKKYIMALTGMMLAGFLLVHTIGNSTIFWGREAFNAYAHHLHSLGIFVPIFEAGLYSIFFIHVITGILLFLDNLKARGSRYHVQQSSGGRTWGSRTMIYTGAALFVFIIIHLLNFHFVEKTEIRTISDVVTEVMNNPGFSILYLVGMAVLGLHISHGLWSLLQTLGISHPRYDCTLRMLTWVLAGVMVAVFVLITLLLVLWQNHLL